MRAGAAERLTKTFESSCDHYGFYVLYSAADRHGAWEWRAARRLAGDSPRYQYMVFAVVESAANPFAEYEAKVGLESGRNFGRRVVGRGQLPHDEAAAELFEAHLPLMIEAVEDMGPRDLTDSYQPERGGASAPEPTSQVAHGT